jgi:hypothetical protein
VKESSSDFRDTLLELIETSPEPVDHPSPDRWLSYHRGELSEDEEAFLQEHLAHCRDCFDLCEAAAAFAEPAEESDTGEEVDSAALWRLLRPRLGVALGPRRRRFREWLPVALAASLVALVGLSIWNLRQQNALDALRTPRPDAPIFDFSAGERLPDSAETTLSASTDPWMLVFHPSDELPVYRLALHDAVAGRELWSYELRPDEDLALTLQLPEGLPPGRYRLELSDGSGGRGGRALETHLLRVTEPARGSIPR